MWTISQAMYWVKVSLIGVLVVVVPIMYLIKKSELEKKAKKEAAEKAKAEYDRQKKLEFYESNIKLNQARYEKITKTNSQKEIS